MQAQPVGTTGTNLNHQRFSKWKKLLSLGTLIIFMLLELLVCIGTFLNKLQEKGKLRMEKQNITTHSFQDQDMVHKLE